MYDLADWQVETDKAEEELDGTDYRFRRACLMEGKYPLDWQWTVYQEGPVLKHWQIIVREFHHLWSTCPCDPVTWTFNKLSVSECLELCVGESFARMLETCPEHWC